MVQVTDEVSAGPVPVGVKLASRDRTILSKTKPSSRIHTLTVCDPVEFTAIVALTLSIVLRLQPNELVKPVMRSEEASSTLSRPTWTESLSAALLPPARPRTQTW